MKSVRKVQSETCHSKKLTINVKTKPKCDFIRKNVDRVRNSQCNLPFDQCGSRNYSKSACDVCRQMALDNSKNTREERVMGLLKEMGQNAYLEESHTYRLLNNLEDKLKKVTSKGDMGTKGGDINKKLSTDYIGRVSHMKVNPDGTTNTGLYNRRPDVKKNVYKKSTVPAKKVNNSPSIRLDQTMNDAQCFRVPDERKKEKTKEAKYNDKLKSKESSCAVRIAVPEQPEFSGYNLTASPSKVQQLRLFWDKFFLTETAIPTREESADFIDKAHFLSEARCEVLEKSKTKMQKKNKKIMEKTISPLRIPMSFRIIPSKQKGDVKSGRKRMMKLVETFSDVDLVLSREVSTCVGKVPFTPSDSSDLEEDTDSINPLSDDLQESSKDKLSELGTTQDQCKVVSMREKLHKLFLADQIPMLDWVNQGKMSWPIGETKSAQELRNEIVQKRAIYLNPETGTLVSCYKTIGCAFLVKQKHIFHCYEEGVIIRKEVANFIDTSELNLNSCKRERKLRKRTTLLPCYFVTIEEPPRELLALRFSGGGDSFYNNRCGKEGDWKKSAIESPIVRYSSPTVDPSKSLQCFDSDSTVFDNDSDICESRSTSSSEFNDTPPQRTTFSFERITYKPHPSSKMNKTRFKLVTGDGGGHRTRHHNKLLSHLIVIFNFTFSFIIVTAFTILLFKYYLNSFPFY